MKELTEQKFWRSIAILINNYHAVNKKIFACIIKNIQKVTRNIAQINDVDNNKNEVQCCICEEAEMLKILNSWSATIVENCEGFLVQFKFLTKDSQPNIEALGIIDFTKKKYTCKIKSSVLDDFAVSFEQNKCCFYVLTQRQQIDISERWLEFVLKPKIIKWAENFKLPTAGKQQLSSLALIDVEKYNELYKDLKQKYAQKALKLWNEADESTDPLKFIYEDLAIAAYLITLWSYHSNGTTSPTAYADLGCGNGLLVYILSEEGYAGYGYDLRARKLWSLYPNTVKLIEQAVMPNDFKVPDEVDWLIGNHSDELSAWLPIMAATSSFKMRYFVLPCCAYEFSGKKFQRRNCGSSVYQDFLQYVQSVSETCGFNTKQDRLKIPSTKRIALIGIERNYAQSDHKRKCIEINNFVDNERQIYPSSDGIVTIKIREKVEAVRNCTKIDRNIIDKLVLKIFHIILECKQNQRHTNSTENWQPGGCMPMREIVSNLSKDDLLQIKSECGGIKTLLRNKHEIFEFCGNDLIGIRKPHKRIDFEMPNKPQTIKKRLCFFKLNHPNGCPLSDVDCTFVH